MNKHSLWNRIAMAIQDVETAGIRPVTCRVFGTLLFICMIAFGLDSASATLISYDTFDYPLGSTLAGQKGGVGFSGPWTPQMNPSDGQFIISTCPNAAGTGVGMVASGLRNLDDTTNGDYAVYSSVNLTGATSFVARVASGSSGGTITIHEGSATGTVIGTLAVSSTGGWQKWSTVSCTLSGATGTQDVYLVFSGATGYLINVEWFSFPGTGSTPIWASNYASVSGSNGIGSQSCSEIECVEYSGNSVNVPVTLSRPFSTPLTGTYYGCYQFSANLTGSSGPVCGLGTGAATDSDNTAAFFWSGNGYESLETNAKANGTLSWGTENIATNTPYIYLFCTNTASNTTTGWVLTTSQLNYFLTNNLLTVANLNSATVGTAGTDVFSRQTATATGSVQSQTNLLILGDNNGQATYNFSFGGFSISNSNLLEAVTGNEELPPAVALPTYNSSESVVAAANVLQYGAVADGVTDNRQAFQAAINAVEGTPSQRAGGVVYVPSGKYAFYGNLTIPSGVTLHGDWQDWTTGTTGAVGTTFAIYTTGTATGTPFITMQASSGVKGINFWYPNQLPSSSPTPYPYTIQLASDSMIQNVVLINSYQGICTSGDPHRSTVSTVLGSPLLMGFNFTGASDVPHAEDIRFSPTAWEVSQLANAPSAGGPQETFMANSGTSIQVTWGDGSGPVFTFTSVSGYNIGVNADVSCNFYGGTVTNCNTAMELKGSGQLGEPVSNMTISGVTAFTGLGQFFNCQITGTGGTAITEPTGGWNSWDQFENCTITGTIVQQGGDLSVVDCTLNAPTQCTIASTAVRTGFTGCTFTPAQNIVNNGTATHLLVDPRTVSAQLPPAVSSWSTEVTRYLACKPAKTTLYVATTGYGATGNGTTDDTSAIQAALNAASGNGGGIVYLPGGHYKTTATLTVPTGVELRGVYELRHACGPWPSSGLCKETVIQPAFGAGTTTGSGAIVLSASSGIRGVDISYEAQTSACTPYPPAIQGNGANVYVIAVLCPNAYNYVDLNTHTCTNHFLYMVDGNVGNKYFQVGNGSSGTIMNDQNAPGYWGAMTDTTSVPNFTDDTMFGNLEMYVLGNCTETLMKGFSINGRDLIDCIPQSGGGSNVTGIELLSDETESGCILGSTSPCNINLVEFSACPINYVPSTGTTSVPGFLLESTSGFTGNARFYNSAQFGTHAYTCLIGGGDVNMQLLYSSQYGNYGSFVTGGVLHLVNDADYIAYPPDGGTDFPVDNVTFTSPGLPGDVSEIIGDYANNGFSCTNSDPGNWLNVWNNYESTTTAVLSDPSSAAGAPIEATSNNGVSGTSSQAYSEGGLNMDYIDNGNYAVYNNVNLNGVTGFVARISCSVTAGSNPSEAISVYLDNPTTGTLIGTLPIVGTGAWQSWVTTSCNLSGATGYHNVYLVFSGGSGALFNLEWFAFEQSKTAGIQGASANTLSGSNIYAQTTCSEGGSNLADINNGSYAVYNNLDLTGATNFVARVSSATALGQTAGTISIYTGALPANGGTLIGTCPVIGSGGGWQNWTTMNCPISSVSGNNTVYLVFNGGSGYMFNVEWFAFEGANPAIQAASYNSVSGSTIAVETGGEDGELYLGNIQSGNQAVYNSIDLNNATKFEARVASSVTAGQSTGGSIAIRLDSPTGTLLGTLPILGTGSTSTYSTQSCNLSGATGYHNLYLNFTGGTGNLFNLEWLNCDQENDSAIEAASFNSVSGTLANATCSEGGLELGSAASGNYAVYNAINLNGATLFTARVASSVALGQSAGTITIHEGSATGTVIGTLNVAGTGGSQVYTTQTCTLSGASGYQNVYLVWAGTGTLPNLEWFAFEY